jgi:hypothetical protein
MVVIFCDLDDENMSLSVLKDDARTVFHYTIKKKDSIGLLIFVQIAPYFNKK